MDVPPTLLGFPVVEVEEMNRLDHEVVFELCPFKAADFTCPKTVDGQVKHLFILGSATCICGAQRAPHEY